MVKSCATLYESYATTAGQRRQVDDHHGGRVHTDQHGRGLASIAGDTSTLISCTDYTHCVVKNCATWYESHDTTAVQLLLGDHHARQVQAGQRRQRHGKWSEPDIMRVVCPEVTGSAPGHITGLLARDVTKRDLP